MGSKGERAIIISLSSDIGTALGKRWLSQGRQVFGTYRSPSPSREEMEAQGARYLPCDLADDKSIRRAAAELRRRCESWDVLVLCPGTLEPVGPFQECPFEDWSRSIQVNFCGQLQFVHDLLPSRNTSHPHGPTVLFFAGGGANSATVNYSAYTASKIALIKMCELLDAEVEDTRFVIVGPGWVETKIHDETIRAGTRAGHSLSATKERLSQGPWVKMEEVLDCCDWLLAAPREVVSGRNFSVASDRWGSAELSRALEKDDDIYKLRRQGNSLLVKGMKKNNETL